MPLPRKKDAGTSGAPVLNLLRAHVKLTDVEEHIEPYTVTRKSDGKAFTFAPSFKATVEIVDDGEDGTYNGTRFFESWKYKQDENGQWFNKQNSKLGALTEVVKPGYFADPSIPELTASDLEGFEMICRVKPKNNPNTGQITGSEVEWDTLQALPKKRQAVTAVPDDDVEDDFDDIPF